MLESYLGKQARLEVDAVYSRDDGQLAAARVVRATVAGAEEEEFP